MAGENQSAHRAVRAELGKVLAAARSALQAFIETPDDRARIRSVLTDLHQVHGTLRLLDTTPLLPLAADLEEVGQQLMNGGVEDVAAAGGALMHALTEFPGLIESVFDGRVPAVSIGALEAELRRTAGDATPIVTERSADLSVLDVPPAPSVLKRFADSDGVGVIRRLRAGYQQCLVAVLRNVEPTRTAVRLAKTVGAMQRLCRGTPFERIWWLFAIYLEAAAHVGGTLSRRGLPVLRRADQELRRIAAMGTSALSAPPPLDFVETLLHELTSLGVRTSRVHEALATFGLADRGDVREMATRDAVSAVAKTLLEEMQAMKEQLDLFARAEFRNVADLAALVPTLGRVGGALAVSGLGALESTVFEQRQRIEVFVAQGRAADEELEAVAEALTQVEEELRLLSGSADETTHAAEARRTVMRESRRGLEEVRQAVVDFIASKWDYGVIESVPGILNAVRGGLVMIDEPDAAALVADAGRYVGDELLAARIVPEWQALDHLADAVTSIDYYLERMQEARTRGDPRVLAIARESVLALFGQMPDDASMMHPAPPVASSPVGRAPTVVDDFAEFRATTPVWDVNAGAAASAAETPVAAAGDVDGDFGPDEVAMAPAYNVADEPEVSARDAIDAAPAATAVAIDAQMEPLDDEVRAVFLEEVDEVLAAIDKELPRWRTDIAAREPLLELRRAFHTLKGSSRMVGATRLGDLGFAVENVLNQLLEGAQAVDQPHVALVADASALVPGLRVAFAGGVRDPSDLAVSQLLARAERMAGGLVGDGGVSEENDADAEARALAETFDTEARIHLDAIGHFAEAARTGDLVTDPLRRAVHSLRGDAAVAGFDNVVAATSGVERWLDGHERIELEDGLVRLRAACRALEAEFGRGRQGEISRETELALAALARDMPAERAATPLFASIERLLRAQNLLEAWRAGGTSAEDVEGLRAELAELAERASIEQRRELAALSLSLVAVYDVADAAIPLTQDVALVLIASHEALIELLDAMAAGVSLPDVKPHVEALAWVEESLIESLSFEGMTADATDKPAPAAVAAAAAVNVDARPAEAATLAAAPASATQPTSLGTPEAAPALQSAFQLPADVDADVLVVFQEEARELGDAIERALVAWQAQADNGIHVETLLRALHTLKGGARLAGLRALGDEAHRFEERLLQQQQRGVPDAGDFADLDARYEVIAGWVDAAVRHGTPAAVVQLPTETTAAAPSEPAVDERRREMVRVAAGLLDELVGLAGESSIARARTGEVAASMRRELEEMGATVERVRDQVRRVEIETEAQVLFRRERVDRAEYADFDPLELDRYSQLQQLARGLSESGQDLLDLEETLRSRVGEIDAILAQQSRLHAELSAGLMRTRMVPFERLLPRLSRIVRQVGRELSKDVELHASTVDGELDRSVLERMIPAFEHMLRNAVDHGIESVALRRAAGKADTGRITLSLRREVAHTVIEIADDGAGIDAAAVRAKARERGLLADGAELDDDAVCQFIFAPGFSTAETVTQISGRGVGMDVVAAEVRALGGSIDIASKRSLGTRFTIRLPFTVAVNRALLVYAGEDVYAIPVNTIEGIVRALPGDLAARYAGDGEFEYAGVSYELAYLGSLLGREQLVRTDVQSLPVLLTRAGDRRLAVHVDGVQGSREIVVKSLGPQLAGVTGVAGATLLGDGMVVIILDLPTLAVAAAMQVGDEVPQVSAAGRPTALVVDDSVTVRKVTSRLLERHGFDVMLAKDGIEAIAQLQERRPDIVLLDIEMPRMDGFEVARQVRHDARCAELPIVMISSRSGDKHRERAAALGVNRFLSKPYQESDLVSVIDELLGVRA